MRCDVGTFFVQLLKHLANVFPRVSGFLLEVISDLAPLLDHVFPEDFELISCFLD